MPKAKCYRFGYQSWKSLIHCWECGNEVYALSVCSFLPPNPPFLLSWTQPKYWRTSNLRQQMRHLFGFLTCFEGLAWALAWTLKIWPCLSPGNLIELNRNSLSLHVLLQDLGATYTALDIFWSVGYLLTQWLILRIEHA